MRTCLLLALFVLISPASAEVPREYQVKAAFLYNFAKFVHWPQSRFAGPESPLVIGVLRSNPFGAELEKAVSGRQINGRSVVVRLVTGSAAARQTHLLFVGSEEDANFADLQPTLVGQAVLTVGESTSFARQGGIITFTPQDGTVRFAINRQTADQAGLKISAQLQKLAIGARK